MYTKILSMAKSYRFRAFLQMFLSSSKSICIYLLIYVIGSKLIWNQAGNLYILYLVFGLYILDLFIKRNYILTWSTKALDKLTRDYIFSLYARSKWGRQEFSFAQILANDINSIRKLSVFYEEIIPQFFEIFLMYLVLFVFYIKTFALGVLIVPTAFILMVLLSFLVKKNQERVNNRRDKRYVNMGQKFLEDLAGITTILMYGAGEKFQENFDQMSEKHRSDIIFSLGLSLPRSAGRIFIANMAIIISSLLLRDKLSPQNIVDFIFITLLNMHIMGLSKKFSYANKQVHMLRPVLTRILDMLAYREYSQGYQNQMDQIEAIRFDDINFAYKDKEIFKNLNLEFTKGKLYGLVGENGSGKSSLIKLIKGQETSYDGNIYINQTNHKDLNQESLAKEIGILEKESYIFDKTIKENLLIAAKGQMTFEEILAKLNKYRLLDFVSIMPLGFDSPAGENGSNLSNGQRQLLSLAMLSVQDKSVYILDEASSSVNPETNQVIMEFIKGLAKDKIVINISHRKSDIQEAEKLIFINKARVVEGSRQDLLQDQDFRSLYQEATYA